VLRNISIQKLLRDYLFQEVVNKFQIETYKGYRRLRLGVATATLVASVEVENRSIQAK
jgi:hypothetical protein